MQATKVELGYHRNLTGFQREQNNHSNRPLRVPSCASLGPSRVFACTSSSTDFLSGFVPRSGGISGSANSTV